ncbi:histone deacetylase Hos1p [[Candida] jaroonii]|uniref:Histone deacetylase Hos1p n=1 Tax=[Candida] jaroonii TaxID=467808 RepID=A0ACA9Y1T8_9ASCO|nr:histone deacetylase Hos1p [[Candida] jaroonii]
MSMRTIVYVSDYATDVCDALPSNESRQSMVMDLLKAYGLDDDVICFKAANKRELTSFHSEEFIDVVLSSDMENRQKDKFGLQDDCPIFEGLAEYVKVVAGSTLTCANHLLLNEEVAINWYGGRHHCGKNSAQGFCYVNDIVLGINRLRHKYKEVFYIDLDLHHGDGVEKAFRYSKNVTTCSLHRYDVGFYPGTGSLKDNTDSVINVPLRKGLNGETLNKLMDELIFPILRRKQPEVLVIQCGCDGLLSDPAKEWNLTIEDYGQIIKKINDNFPVPKLILGGGGYNHSETAKCWTYITKILKADDTEFDMIPDHKYVDEYEPSGYRFWYHEKSLMKDYNDHEYINSVISSIIKNFT